MKKRLLTSIFLALMALFALPVEVWGQDYGTEEVVNEEKTWLFNDYTPTTTQTTCPESSVKSHVDKLYNRSASSGRGFVFTSLETPLELTLPDNETKVTVNVIASSSSKYDNTNQATMTAGAAGNSCTPYFAFNAKVAGTCYAYVKNASGSTRIIYTNLTTASNVASSSITGEWISYTSIAGGTFSVGGITKDVQRDIYVIRFVPSVYAPTITKEGNTVTITPGAVNIDMKSGTSVTTYYTVDGSDPNNSETRIEYTGPISNLTGDVTIKAVSNVVNTNDKRIWGVVGEYDFVYIPTITIAKTGNANGAITASVDDSPIVSGGIVESGKTVTLTISPTGYKATSLTVKDGNNTDVTKTTVNSGTKYTFTMPGSDVTVSATIGTISYNLSYDLAEGTVDTDNPTNYSVESETITLNNPTRAGYTFAGWTGTGLDGATPTVTIAQGSTGDRTYTATWTQTATPEEKTVSTETTWIFNDYTTTENKTTTISESANLYNRSTSNGGKGFTFEAIESQNLKFSDGKSVTVTKIAKSLSTAGSSISTSYLTAGDAGSSNTPMFAINTTVPGTFYALVKNGSSDNNKIRLYYGKVNEAASNKVYNTGSDLQELKFKATDEDGGVFFIGGIANGIECNIYALRFVPSTYEYTITTPASVENGTFTVKIGDNNVAGAVEGATVTITTTPNSGYEADAVIVKDADENDVTVSGSGNSYTFSMPAKNVTVTVTFKEIPTIYGTYDFRTFAKTAFNANGEASIDENDTPVVIGSSNTKVMKGTFTGLESATVTGSMNLKNVLGMFYSADTYKMKLVKTDEDATTGISIPRGANNQVELIMYGLKQGDWFKLETGDIPLYINKVNNSATISFYDLDNPEKTNVARDAALEAGHTYVATADITSMELYYNASSHSGNAYLYSAQISNGDAIPAPTIGSYDFATGLVDITVNNSLKGQTPTVYYTTDGTNPTTSSSVYDAINKISLTEACTIKAMAYIESVGQSTVAEKEVQLEIVSKANIGDLSEGSVTITAGTTNNTTSGVTVTTYYTLDGSTPTAEHNDGSFTEASKAVAVDQTRIVKAITISSTEVSSDVVTKKIVVDAATPATTWDFVNDATLSPLVFGDALGIRGYYYDSSDANNDNFINITNSSVHSKMSWLVPNTSDPSVSNTTGTGLKDNYYRAFAINDLHVGDKIYVTYTGGTMNISSHSTNGNTVTINGTAVSKGSKTAFDSGAAIEVTGLDNTYNYVILKPASNAVVIQKIEINPIYTITNGTADEGITVTITKENDASTDKTFSSTFERGTKVTLTATYTAPGKKLVWMDGENNVLEANADGTLTVTLSDNMTIKASLAIPVWTVNNVSVESYTALTEVDGVQIHGNEASGHSVKVTSLSPAKTGTFSNTEASPYSVSKYLEIPGAVSATTDEIANKAATMRLTANNTEALKEYLAMDVTQSGTLYVIYRPNSATEGRNVYVGFQKASDNSYTKTVQSATLGTDYTEIKHSGNGVGTYFVYGSIAAKVYAIMFIPETVKILTTVASPADGGIIKVTNGNAIYEGAANGLAVEPNAVLTLEATANTGYNFSAWSENVTSGSVTMDEDKTVTATFEAITYPLTITQPETGGSITATVDEISYSESTNVLENKTVTLSAAPADGYQLVGWTDGTNALGDLPKSLVNTITMTEAKTATATFEAIPTVAGVTEESVWTFDGFYENTILSDKTVYGYNNGKGTLYISGHSTSGSITAAAKVVAGNMTEGQVVGTGEAVQPEKCLQLQGGGISSLAVSRTANSFTPDAIAFQAGVPGTVYVLMSGGYKTGETRSINIAANKSETDNTKKAIYSTTLTEGDPVQVVSCEIAEASSVFIGTSGGGKNIYAVKFVPAPTYAISKSEMTNGDVTIEPVSASAGQTVTLTVVPADNYRLKSGTLKATYNDGEDKELTITDNTFVMPAYAVTVSAEFEEIPSVYGTYDFRSFAKANLEVDGAASIGKTEGNVMTGNFTGISNTMTLKDAFGISYNAADKEIKLVRGADETTTGVAIPRGSAGQVGFYMYGLKAGDWFKVETGEVPLYINKVNDGATIYFYDIDDTSKTNVARNSEIVSGHTYVASQDITSMELNYNTSNTGNIYIYSAQLSNGDAVPSPTIGSYDFTTGKVEITANNSLKGNVPTAIYYTTDGTDPTNVMDNDHKYTGAIALTEATTIKAVAVLGEIKSTVAEKLVELETVNVPEVGELTDGKVTITAGTSTNPAVTTNTTYYTLDGSEPSAENNDGSFTEASKAIEIDQTRWLKTVTISSTGVSSEVKAQKVVVDAATPSIVIDFVKDVTELKYGKENLTMYYYYNDGDTNEAKYNKSNAKFNYIVNPEVHTRLAVLSSDQNAVSSTADGLKVLNNGRPIAINDLHAGDKVYVTYTSTGNMKTAIYPERGDVVTIGEADVESKDTEVETGQEVVVKTVSTDYNYLMLMPVKDMIITKIEINPSFTITNMTASDSGVTGVKVIKVDDATVDETFASEETKSFIRGSKVTLQASYTTETGKSLLWLDAEDNELEANADGTLTLTVDADLKVKALYTTGITVTEVKNAENKMVARKLNNGLLEVTFDNNGRITAIKDVKSGKEVMASDDNNQRGYFNFNYRPSKDANVIDFGLECKSSGDIVQIGKSGSQQVELIYPTADAATPSHQTWKIGYVMKVGVSGIYTYAIMDGSSSYSELHEARYGWRVNPDIFNYAWVSDSQKGKMPTPTQMKNYVEEVQDATYKLDDGTIYTKYDWANFVKDDQLHGIMGDGIGAWLISPSVEWVNGGPQKQELTVHATDTTPIM